jgi:putative addiction module killer protein
MYSIEKTAVFDKWIRRLKDQRAKAKILVRIQRIQEDGNFGDCEPVGNGISELRIQYSKGYRIYIKEYKGKIVILLSGGTKSSQQVDIAKAKELWIEVKNNLKNEY